MFLCVHPVKSIVQKICPKNRIDGVKGIMLHYKHLSFIDRMCLERALKAGLNKREIAEMLGVHISTIYRELRRGRYTHMDTNLLTEEWYSPDIAEEKYRAHLAAKGGALKIGNDHPFAKRIEYLIAQEKYSPAAALSVVGKEGAKTMVCRNTLYSYIDKGIFLHLSNKDLPVKGKRRKRYRKIHRMSKPPNGESIEYRPDGVLDRTEPGHWEMDTVVGRKKGRNSVLLVLTERRTRREHIIKMPDKTADSVVYALDTLEHKYKSLFPEVFKSITVDNGTEFSNVRGMERSRFTEENRTKIYFCHAYSAWERGSNENLNKMIRRHFPKSTDFNRISKKRIQQVEDWMNEYPREIFGYRSAKDVWNDTFPYF